MELCYFIGYVIIKINDWPHVAIVFVMCVQWFEPAVA